MHTAVLQPRPLVLGPIRTTQPQQPPEPVRPGGRSSWPFRVRTSIRTTAPAA